MRGMNVTALQNFRNNVRTEAERQHISQRSLAELAGIAYPYLNRVLREKADPSLTICEKIAGALGFSLEDMLADKIQNPEEMMST